MECKCGKNMLQLVQNIITDNPLTSVYTCDRCGRVLTVGLNESKWSPELMENEEKGVSEDTIKKLTSMKLHSVLRLEIMDKYFGSVTVLRVPGGWLYRTVCNAGDSPFVSQVFVPEPMIYETFLSVAPTKIDNSISFLDDDEQ
jgi:hypothetical protein